MTTRVHPQLMSQYDRRSDVVSDISGRLLGFPEGWIVGAGSLAWIKMPAGHGKYGANPIADMPGWAPVDWASPEHWGENGDGVDMLSAFQACLNYCGDLFAPMYLFAREYRLTGTAYMSKPVQISGTMPSPTESVWYSGTDAGRRGNGTWLHFDHTGVGIKLGGAEGNRENTAERFSGYMLKGFGSYRNQPTSDTGFSPTVCEWDFLIESHDYCNPIDGRVEDLVLWNSYKGICGRRDPTAVLNASSFGACKFDNIIGQPLQTGIFIDDSFQVCNFTRIRFWVWYMNKPNVIAWTQANGVAFEFGKADGHKLTHCFSYGYKHFIRTSLSVSSDDSVYGATLDITDCGGDAAGTTSYKFEGRNGRISMVAAEAFGGVHALHVSGTDNSVNVASGKMRRFTGAAINNAGTGNTIAINGPTITDHDFDGSGDAAVYTFVGNTTKVLSSPDFLTVAAPAPSVPLYGGGGTLISEFFDAADQILGYNQTWRDVTGSRAANTSYQNTTGRPIMASMTVNIPSGNERFFQISSDGSTWIDVKWGNGSSHLNLDLIVPDGWYYRMNGTGTVRAWAELRDD